MNFGFFKKTKPLLYKYSSRVFDNLKTPTYKNSTNIAGMPVSKFPREEAIQVYTEILDQLKAIPEDANYRKTIEYIARHRIRIIEENEDIRRIELELGMIQIEQIIEEGRDELLLIPKMIEWKPWDFDGETEIVIGD